MQLLFTVFGQSEIVVVVLFFLLTRHWSCARRPGLTLTVGGLVSLPFNWWSEAITRRIGHVNVLIIAFFGYAIRYIGYSFIRCEILPA